MAQELTAHYQREEVPDSKYKFHRVDVGENFVVLNEDGAQHVVAVHRQTIDWYVTFRAIVVHPHLIVR